MEIDLSGRIARLEALSDLDALRARYCYAVDLEDWGLAASLFVEDGEYVGGLGRAVGRANIQKLFAASVPGAMKRAWHHCHNGYSHLTDLTHATGATSHELYFIMDGRARVAIGRYADLYRKVGADWGFARRVTMIDHVWDWRGDFADAPALA